MKTTFSSFNSVLIAGGLITALLLAISGCTYGQRASGYGTSENPERTLSDGEMRHFWRSIPEHRDADYLYRLGRHFQQRGRYELAIQPFLQVIERDPQRVDAYNALGVSYDQLSKFDLAKQCYQRALILKPDFAAAYNNLGYSCLMQGRPDAAIEYLHRAISLQNSNPRFHNNLALAYRRSGRDLMTAGISGNVESSRIDKTPGNPVAGWHADQVIARAIADIHRRQPDHTATSSSGSSMHENQAWGDPAPPRPVTTTIKGTHPASPDNDFRPVWVAPQIVIANGNGEYRMARNMGRYFADKGFDILRLANADHFGYARTQIVYNNGQRQDACDLARLLFGPAIECDLISTNRTHGPVKVLIGRDIAGLNLLLNGRLRIQVANGNGAQGMAGKLTAYFRTKGYTVSRPTNAGHFNYQLTQIIYPTNRLDNARFLARELPGNCSGNLVHDERLENRIHIIIGKDFRM